MTSAIGPGSSRVFRDDKNHPYTLGPEADAGYASAMQWFASEAGQRLLAGESEAMGKRLSDRFGYHLVQVGGLPGVDLLSTSRILQRCVVDLTGTGVRHGHPSLRGRASALPVETDVADVVVLPHVLEFEPRPHEALREAARILRPEGHLFVSALNPWSLMGLWRLLRRHTGNPPWHGRFLAQGRLRDWLKLVGLELVSVDGFFFLPPLRNPRMLDRLSLLESAGRRLWPPFNGAYLLSARKRLSRATPVRALFRYRPRLVGVSLAGPPARVTDGD